MADFKIFLDPLMIDIRYSFGHLYWDRCGQTIFDIETKCDGWFSAKDEKNIGRLENPEKRMFLVFNDSSFSISVKKPEKLENDIIVEELKKTWKIARANFGLEEFNRVGCRFNFLKPTRSIEESEQYIKKSNLKIAFPNQLEENNYSSKIQQVVVILEKDNTEYRIEMKGITRSEAIDPSGLYPGRPDTLAKRQKEFRLIKMKRLAEYSSNPMYAVLLDVDCAEYHPENIAIGEYFENQYEIVKKDFLPIMEQL